MRELLKKIPHESEAPKDRVDYMLCLALDVGEGMLKNGAEIHRVEDTVDRLCRAYGAVHVEIFAIPSVIIAAVRMSDGKYSSQIRRVKNCTNNMFMVEQYNKISRTVCNDIPELEELDGMIRNVKKIYLAKHPYHLTLLN